MNVESLMSREPRSVRASDSMNHAAELMWDGDVGCVPVVDEDDRVVAMLTDRDICMAAYTRNRPLTDMTVADAMSKQVFSCKSSDSLDKAEKLMAEKQVRRLPVVDGQGRLKGVISMNDLAREAAREKPLARKVVTPDEVVTALAATCQPRPGTSIAAA